MSDGRAAAWYTATAVYERDLWLVRAAAHLRGHVSQVGLVVPQRITVRSGPTEQRDQRPTLGECWPSHSSPEGIPAVVINEAITDPVRVLATLMHELIHAADDCASGHGPWFAGWANALGLVVGLSGATCPSPSLRRDFQRLARGLGPYPPASHGYLIHPSGRALA